MKTMELDGQVRHTFMYPPSPKSSSSRKASKNILRSLGEGGSFRLWLRRVIRRLAESLPISDIRRSNFFAFIHRQARGFLRRRIKTLYLVVSLCLIASVCCADTLILKSGKTIEGTVIDRTDSSITIDFHGIALQYRVEDIERIESEKSTPPPSINRRKTTVVAVSPKPSQKSFLWQVRSATNTVYLLGSIHVAKAGMYPLPQHIENAFRASDIVVFETDLSRKDSPEVQQLTLKYASYPGSATLQTKLSSTTYERTKQALYRFLMPIALFEKFKPWYVATTLQQTYLTQLGYDLSRGIDMYFFSKAQGEKSIEALESWEYQLSLFGGLTDAEQELFLLSSLLELDSSKEFMEKIFVAWQTGDTQTMEYMVITKHLTKYPRLASVYEKLFYRRNELMVRKIEHFLTAGKDYFVVVGSGHLIGERGIVELLQKKGYKIKHMQ